MKFRNYLLTQMVEENHLFSQFDVKQMFIFNFFDISSMNKVNGFHKIKFYKTYWNFTLHCSRNSCFILTYFCKFFFWIYSKTKNRIIKQRTRWRYPNKITINRFFFQFHLNFNFFLIFDSISSLHPLKTRKKRNINFNFLPVQFIFFV